MPTISISSQQFNVERVSDLLCSALEGGSNYWYMIEEFIEPPTVVKTTGLDGVFRHLDYPCSPGGALMVSDAKACNEGSKRTERLDLTSMARGLEIMREKYTRHFADWVHENDDADTGDVFLQCCLFGEVVYG